MAIRAEHLNLNQLERAAEATQSSFLQRLIDQCATYIPQALSVPQFATLYAVLKRLVLRRPKPLAISGEVAGGLDVNIDSESVGSFAAQDEVTPIGLDELDSLARTRAGYAFAELTPEIQDAMLDLIATRDLTAGKVDLALWLEDIQNRIEPAASLPALHQ